MGFTKGIFKKVLRSSYLFKKNSTSFSKIDIFQQMNRF
ncbi:hypothetical protein M472_07300 [Sphingobacterium paucimobilis HER1398]|uniref:Uncharacterized protein n=1 Tax=Sphingobacterium paucimobilis HER1398 TaxID=1346330 RepID=U2J7G1_9SPHI|nr:hypothetical protein M472_07300 [Sphingobacterium paucimobilis HER1398]